MTYYIEDDDWDEDELLFAEELDEFEEERLSICPTCDGTGRNYIFGLGSDCRTCNGEGEVIE